ncbi:MAG: phosphatidylserine decarboxylase [Oscillospiraceae bacterium]|nr:phosphatidylserine decarboxylase [Oscillospiraceae bacterium]
MNPIKKLIKAKKKKKNLQKSNRFLRKLYETKVGRLLLKALTIPAFSAFVGRIMDSKYSKPIIVPFMKLNGIDLDEYEDRVFDCFNDFFTRQIKAENREIDYTPEHLISPCDGKISVYPINEETVFPIKGSQYTMYSILRNRELAEEYKGGNCVVIRLSVDNYHRYCYIDNGTKTENTFIPGVLHTVNPLAFDHVEVFKENCREYCIIHTENFGDVIHMEVGALLVGQISNYHGACACERGAEKGRFEYGGSTIVLFFKKDAVKLKDRLWTNTAIDIETPIKMGEVIGFQNIT